jgi:hypothetical protein
VIELRDDRDFAQEPVVPDRFGQLRPQDLEGDRTVVLQVAGRGWSALGVAIASSAIRPEPAW